MDETLASNVRLGNNILLLSDRLTDTAAELKPYEVWNIRKANSVEGLANSKVQLQLYDQFDTTPAPTRIVLLEPDSNIKLANVKKSECVVSGSFPLSLIGLSH